MKSARSTEGTPDGIRYIFYPDEITSFTPGFVILEMRWYHWYSSIRISIDLSLEARRFMQTVSMGQLQRSNERDYVNEFRVYDLNNRISDDRNSHLLLVDAIEGMASEILEGIRITNSFRYCFSCNDLRLVDLIADKWLCETCQAKYTLNSNIPSLSTDTKAQKSEREKMTKKLRFQILERDGFRCKACGADPRNDDEVRLHVDHIVPIALGGKTVEDNLQTLCQKCNQGKGADTVEQMTLWD